ncbi:MAG TPA: pyruvate:ferredoxin (flavodoxin) oxidoreductase, partial [Bacilli bacterium]|nr:pyruvate:ferredoxin (flavodoxin) oxidoreductase [Bacilli bacterium]
LGQAVAQQKLAVDCGYQILMRYQPEQELLTIDSREPNFNEFANFLDSEMRYHALKLKEPEAAQELYKLNQEAAQKRYLAYQEMAKKQG